MTLRNTSAVMTGLFLVILLSGFIEAIPAFPLQNTQCTRQEYRPRYHFSPKEGWINDPNGMIYYDGIYHLYYQYHPNSTIWGPMHWGHALSRDLITWEEVDIALYPDPTLGFIFSGSSVVDNINSAGFKPANSSVDPIVAIYTHASGENHEIQRQSIAYSLDKGMTFKPYDKNPVLVDASKKDFRDPKVFYHHASDQWVMSLAVQDRIEFFVSPDLKNWTLQSGFGNNPKQGGHDGVWECPDLIPLNVDISDKLTIEVWVLLVSINPGGPNLGSATQYFIGDFARNASGQLEFNSFDWNDAQWLDWGPDNYAGVTFSNQPKGRSIYMAWMNNWDYANHVPTSSWRGQITVPREISVKSLNHSAKQYRLVSTPVRELTDLRHPQQVFTGEEFMLPPSTRVNLTDQASFETPTMELAISLNVSQNALFSICAYNSENEEICFGLNGTQWQLDRSKSGNVVFNDKFSQTLRAHAKREISDEIINIRMFLDVSSLEVFADDGLTTMTALHYPTKPFDKFYINHWSRPSSPSTLTVLGYNVWGLHCWFPETNESNDENNKNGSTVIAVNIITIVLAGALHLFR